MPPRDPNPRWDSGAYQTTRRKWRPKVEAGGVCCWRCGRLIVAGKVRQPDGRGGVRMVDNWHLGHDDWDRSIIRGPEHLLCNLRAAGRKAGLLKRARAERRRRAFGPVAGSRFG